MEFSPHDYQKHSIEFILNNPYCGLFLDMGLGKTVTTLTAINDLKYDMFEISKTLVIAPLRVAEETWSTEIHKWNHLKHLTISKVLGSESNRKKALRQEADIYIINRENVCWLVAYLDSHFPFDMIVIDELSSFKSAKSQRFKSLRQIRPNIKRVVGLTGTPAPNGLIDLWPQIYLLDMGARLGKTISSYRENFFVPGRSNGHVVFNYKLKDSGEERIYEKISDICMSMKSEDYLQLPEKIDNYIDINFSDKLKSTYIEFEKTQVLRFMDSEEITAVNAAALTNKLLQFANGCLYDENLNVKEIHKLKVDALDEIVDTANGKPVLVFYSYRHDLQNINKHLKKYKPRVLKKAKDIEDWNKGEVQLLLAHPASAGHGLNLQAGGNIIVWYGHTWSLELYQQANARLHRQGQENRVIVHHLVSKGTMDEDVINALSSKAEGQEALMDAVKARVNKYKEELVYG